MIKAQNRENHHIMGFLPKHVERNVGITETLCTALDTPYRIKITIIKT